MGRVCGPWDMIVAQPVKKNIQQSVVPVTMILVMCCLLDAWILRRDIAANMPKRDVGL
jgi:hypothetical protein